MFQTRQILLIIILFFLLLHISIQDKKFFYERAKNIFCSDYENGCSFNISSSYPYSPIIPTELVAKCGLIMSCRYQIYIQFDIDIPSENKTTFYLMAYDTSDGTTIINNGDYYEIKLKYSTYGIYQLEIEKEIKDINFIQFLFLGIPNNIQYLVYIKFESTYSLYVKSLSLDYYNSLYSNNSELMLQYIKEYSLRLNEAIERANNLIVFLTDIIKQIFDATISFGIPQLSGSQTIYIPPSFLLTASYSVAIETSVSKFFKPEKYIIGENIVQKGKIIRKFDGYELLKGNNNNNPDNNLLKMVESFNKELENTILEMKILENEICSITVSTNGLLNSVIISINFSEDLKIAEINRGVEIKIEIINNLMKESVQTAPAMQYVYSSFIEEEKKTILNGMLIFIAFGLIAATIASGGIATPAAAGLMVLPLA